jgi:hypothetical protein
MDFTDLIGITEFFDSPKKTSFYAVGLSAQISIRQFRVVRTLERQPFCSARIWESESCLDIRHSAKFEASCALLVLSC